MNLNKLLSIKNRIGFFILLFTYVSNPMFAQSVKTTRDFKVKLSTPYRVIDAAEKYYFHEGNDIIMIKVSKQKFSVQRFDTKTMREVSVKEIRDFPEGYTSEGFAQVKDKVLCFYALWDRKNTTEQLFVRELNMKTGAFEGSPVLVLPVKGKIAGDYKPAEGYGLLEIDKFQFGTSYDSAKVVVRYRKRPESKNDSKNYDQIGLFVFNYDNGLKKVWGDEFKMPYNEKMMDELDFDVDSEGNIYLLAKVYAGDDNKRIKDKDGFTLYSLEILKGDAQTQKLTAFKVDVPQKFINEITLIESEDKFMALTGFYNVGKKKENGVDGVFISKFSKSGEITDMHSYEIPLEILNQNVSKKEASKNTKKEEDDDDKGAQLKSLELSGVITSDDGSFIIMGEQVRVVTTETRSSSGTRTTHRYYFEDMLATKINSDGTLAWMKRLPKSQTGGKYPGGMSYKYISGQNSHYFLFLDHVENLTLAENKEPVYHRDGAGGYLTAYKLAKTTGDVSKLSIVDTKNVSGTEVFQFQPARLLQISPTEFIMEAYKKDKEDIMVKISLTEEIK